MRASQDSVSDSRDGLRFDIDGLLPSVAAFGRKTELREAAFSREMRDRDRGRCLVPKRRHGRRETARGRLALFAERLLRVFLSFDGRSEGAQDGKKRFGMRAGEAVDAVVAREDTVGGCETSQGFHGRPGIRRARSSPRARNSSSHSRGRSSRRSSFIAWK